MISAAIQAHWFQDTGSVPNNPTLPLLVMPNAVPPGSSADVLARQIEACYARHGWQGTWRWGVYPFAHYHSTAHEVLTCFRGWAYLQLGGDSGIRLPIRPGDTLLIPAGVGHQKLESSDDFQVCGAYPPKQEPDLIRADEIARHESARRHIRTVRLPETDPLFGKSGPLLRAWRRASARGTLRLEPTLTSLEDRD